MTPCSRMSASTWFGVGCPRRRRGVVPRDVDVGSKPVRTGGDDRVGRIGAMEHVMTSRRRTEFAAFVLDLLDFTEEKMQEALDDESSRSAALGEAAGAMPVLRDRLGENEVVAAQFVLGLGNIIEQRWAEEWWDGFAKMDRQEFEAAARDLVGPEGRLPILRKIVAAGC